MGQDERLHDRGAKVVATGYANEFDVDIGPLFKH
jgi:methylmalonyl-CoA mutase cobalamin-binding domain/chain